MANKPNKIQRICATCGKDFYTIPYYVKKGQGRYCSNQCRIHLLNKGFRLVGLSLEKARASLIKRYRDMREKKGLVLCNHRYRDEYRFIRICPNYKKVGARNCGGHTKVIKQRYYQHKYNPEVFLDITL